MRKHIAMYYKTYDGQTNNEMDRLMDERLNDYGYNFESNKKKTISLDDASKKSGPHCLRMRKNGEKRW